MIANVVVPSVCTVGELFELRILIVNKLWTSERVNLVMEMSDNFVVTGSTAALLEVLRTIYDAYLIWIHKNISYILDTIQRYFRAHHLYDCDEMWNSLSA